jgi:hypothetical protein
MKKVTLTPNTSELSEISRGKDCRSYHPGLEASIGSTAERFENEVQRTTDWFSPLLRMLVDKKHYRENLITH